VDSQVKRAFLVSLDIVLQISSSLIVGRSSFLLPGSLIICACVDVCVCVCLYRYNSLRGWLPFSWVSLSDNQKGPKISCWRILPDCKNMRGSRERTNEKRIKHLFVRLSRPSFLFFPDACCVHTRFHHRRCFLHHMDRDDDSSTPPPSPYPKYVRSCIRILI
jgi:hypothetical protein